MKVKSEYYQRWNSLLFSFGAIILTGCYASATFVTSSPVNAQIVPDNTLPINSSVTPGCTACTIEGGTVRGSNLFHSFSEFGVPTGGKAFFNNATSIENIFTRVTGNSISNIDGLIRVVGGANLFFLNPNGIIFGTNARLDIGGSFLATTASSILFANGTVFNTKPDTSTTPLLTVSVPIGLQFNGREGNIVVRSSRASPVNPKSESGDAGQLPNTAQIVNTSGTSPSTISGRLSDSSDVDLYQIFLPAGQSFQATTEDETVVDTRLFLFDSSGRGLYSNDDSVEFIQSTVPFVQPFTPTTAGTYYLGITSSGNKPTSDDGLIFDENYGYGNPIGSGAKLPLSGWDNKGTDSGDYTIRLISNSSVNLPSAGLQIQPGRTLALVGGNITIEGGKLQAPGGRVELAAVKDSGVVELIQLGQKLQLNVPEGLARADLSLTNKGQVNVRAGGGGSIVINARNLNISGADTWLRAGIARGLGSVGSKAGDIAINVTEATNLDVGMISNSVLDGSMGNGGDLNIVTGSLNVTNGALLYAISVGEGKAGNLNINARDTVTFDGVNSHEYSSGAFTALGLLGVGNGGNLNIATGSLNVTNGAVLNANTSGKGKAGNININARDTVIFDGESAAFSSVYRTGKGDGGNINLTTGSLFLTNGAFLSAGTSGQGKAGNVNIDARDTVAFNGIDGKGHSSGIFSIVAITGVGNGGNLNITTESLVLSNNAVVSARTRGQGNGGDITVNANTIEALSGGQVLTTTTNTGKAGDITLNVTQNVMLSGSDPTYLTRIAQFGTDVLDSVDFSSGLFANTLSTSTNQGGNLTINTGQLTVRDGAQVTVSSEGLGIAGSLIVSADSIRLDNEGKISADTSGSGGNIDLRARDLLLLRRGSSITTNATSAATGGNITINTNNLVAVPQENSDISANALDSFGGQIIVNASGIFGTEFRDSPTPLSDITATSARGYEFNGAVQINTPDVNPSQGLTALPTNIIDTSQLIANSCIARSKRPEGKFIITGNGGSPVMPDDPAVASYQTYQIPTVTSASISKYQENTANTNKHEIAVPAPFLEATGWVYGSNGEVILTSFASTVVPDTPWSKLPTCSG
ncbi:filamentous hemagglutinin N-terminal domain-containing protein [Nostoc sp. UHCC 0302]|uniref:two-partner secretion domain-containing protein n=1 Tax=Nostoc sp. UHCC 0302 TaxID=3134896 RepID=UPI00311CC922